MPRVLSRVLIGGVAALALTAAGGGVACAADSASTSQENPHIWVVPGLDAGSLLGLTSQVPELALRPVADVLGALGGL